MEPDPSLRSVFRDSHGVVHTVSSTDPLLDLPGDTARALAAALLQPAEADLEVALDRCEAVRELLERWQDAFFAALPDEIDLAEEARWAAEAGMSLAEVEAGYADEEDEDDDDPLGLAEVELTHDLGHDLGLADLEPTPDEIVDLPEELVQLLERELLLLPLRVRLEALVAAAALVSAWSDLFTDHEKLLGHLALAHSEPVVPAGHTTLADRHALLHATHGPGHPEP